MKSISDFFKKSGGYHQMRPGTQVKPKSPEIIVNETINKSPTEVDNKNVPPREESIRYK